MLPVLIRLFGFITVRLCLVWLTLSWLATRWWAVGILFQDAPDIYFTRQGIVLVNGDASNLKLEFRTIDEQKQLEYWDNSPSVLAYEKIAPGIHRWFARWNLRTSRIGIQYFVPFAFLFSAHLVLSFVYRRKGPAPRSRSDASVTDAE